MLLEKGGLTFHMGEVRRARGLLTRLITNANNPVSGPLDHLAVSKLLPFEADLQELARHFGNIISEILSEKNVLRELQHNLPSVQDVDVLIGFDEMLVRNASRAEGYISKIITSLDQIRRFLVGLHGHPPGDEFARFLTSVDREFSDLSDELKFLHDRSEKAAYIVKQNRLHFAKSLPYLQDGFAQREDAQLADMQRNVLSWLVD